MSSGLKRMFKTLFDVEPSERIKLFFLTATFFFVIAGYTLVRELRDSIFSFIVGKEYLNTASIISMCMLVPLILVYSKLVDKMRRYYLLCTYSIVYGLITLLFAYLLGDPVIGLPNTDASQYRMIGWIFYFFVEGYSPFVVSVFWAFANSVNSPESARKNYGLMSSGSKVGGMLTAGLAWALLSGRIFTAHSGSDTFNHQVILVISACMTLLVPVFILLLMKYVPGKNLHGYEAAYQVEKQKKRAGKESANVFVGLKMLLKYPYVLGMFSMVFFFEILGKVISYQRVKIAHESGASQSDTSAFLFKMIFFMHAAGFLISLLGTRTLLNKLGEKRCLVLVPLITGALLLYFVVSYTAVALIVTGVGIKALNYAFAWPVRENLYIPTVKEIKFKSKSWIDAFGSKFGKSTGATFNIIAQKLGTDLFFPAHYLFFSGIVGVWLLVAYLLGRRFERAIENNEVIGEELESVEDEAVQRL